MKPAIVITLSVLFVTIGLNAQTSTLVNNHQLMATPTYSADKFYSISKTDLVNIDLLASNLGEIKEYTISFKMMYEGCDSYFSKKIKSNSLDKFVKEKLDVLEPGSKFYLEDITIASYTQKSELTSKAQFVITE